MLKTRLSFFLFLNTINGVVSFIKMSFFTAFIEKFFLAKSASDCDSNLLQLSSGDCAVIKSVDPEVVVGQILSVRAHKDPAITKVRVTMCDIGCWGIVQILCGGTNISEGQIVPVARVGTVLPGDFKISVRDIRGEESHGMICARSELGLSAEGEVKGEIWDLPDALISKLGVPLFQI